MRVFLISPSYSAVTVPNFIEFGQHLGSNQSKFGTGIFLLNFMARFGVLEVISGWFRSFHLLVCTPKNVLGHLIYN